MTNFLVGTDIHREYYYSSLTYAKGWDPSESAFYNTSLASSLLVPYLAKVFNISLYVIYKGLIPILLALVPVVLFHLFKGQFKEKMAFLSCIFFVSIPTYLVELTGISKQQFSELFFALTLFLLVLPWKAQLKYPLILLCLILTILAHYTLGALLMALLLGFILITFFLKNRTAKLKYLVLILLVGLVIYGGYYSQVADGRVLATAGKLLKNFTGISTSLLYTDMDLGSEWGGKWEPSGAEWGPMYSSNGTANELTGTAVFTQVSLTKVALGLDFFQASDWGKVFRIFQLATEALLILGCLILFRMRKKLSPEYLALCLVSAAMMAVIIIIPGASATMNATRFYNIALLTLAPAFVLGGLAVLKKPWLLVALVMIPYLLFTSGFIFEVSHQTEVGTDLPYTHALSAERVDTTGLFTENDGIVRDWIMSNPQARPIIADWHTLTLLQDTLSIAKDLDVFPTDLKDVPGDYYVLFRERNEKYQEIGYWGNVGTTVEVSYERAGVSKMLEGRQIVFQSGLAKLYGPREE
jgi:uncharacterized membrane protein